MQLEMIHHVSLVVSDLEKSKQFYREILGLKEIPRPPFDFPGAWFAIGGNQHLHLLVHTEPTFRTRNTIDTRDLHFSVRVPSYSQTLEFLRAKGYLEDVEDGNARKMKVYPHAVAGYPQIYIIDPDRHIIEINADKLD